MATPEGKVKAKVDKLLSQYKSELWFFSPQSGIYGKAGIPDRIACYRGHLIGIEVKADRTKKPTPHQKHCMAQIERAGGRCFVVYDDETLKDVEDYLSVIKDMRTNDARIGTSQSPDTET